MRLVPGSGVAAPATVIVKVPVASAFVVPVLYGGLLNIIA
jgi:hypothetical protein